MEAKRGRHEESQKTNNVSSNVEYWGCRSLNADISCQNKHRHTSVGTNMSTGLHILQIWTS